MLRPLDALLDAIDRRDPAARFLFVGDYVNRGPDSRGVIDRLLALPMTRASFARGNHDDTFDMVLHGQSYCPDSGGGADPVAAFKWFMNFGLDMTFASYGIPPSELLRVVHDPKPARLKWLCEAVPERHRLFIRSLPSRIDEPDLFVAHASWPGDAPNDPAAMEARLDRDMSARHRILWGRFGADEIAREKPAWTRRAFFGHTPVENYPPELRENGNRPVRGPSVTLLDTAAALGPTGRLSAVCAETDEVVQVDRLGAMV